ncbi:hypothetical protein C6341_g12221 [Phytophthora cactorum]|nr:hypothetical protein C6341_g12221 [Phytophthora cactorum]
MVKLFCAIVGVAGSAFEVDIDEGASVAALKKKIKEEKPNKIQCDADELQLFLAKTERRRVAEVEGSAPDAEGGDPQ